jgi:hypothetical protein
MAMWRNARPIARRRAPCHAIESASRLERIARELDAEPDEVRWWLREEVDRRSRARAAKHAVAHKRLDARLA